MYINMQLPKAASQERTGQAARQVEKILENTPGVQYTTSVIGFSLLSFVRTSYNAFFFVTLKPWGERKKQTEQYQSLKDRLNQELKELPAGTVFSFSPPAIPGVGTAGGFTFVLEDRVGKDVQFLADNLDKFLAAAQKRPEISQISTTFLPGVPQQFVNVDRDKVLKQGVALTDVYNTIQAFMGGLFINYFNDFGRTWQVYVEAEAPYRSQYAPKSLTRFMCATTRVPGAAALGIGKIREPALARSSPCAITSTGPPQINGSAAPGYSSDQATAALEEVFKQTMPREMGFDYIGMSYQEQKAREGVPAWDHLRLLFPRRLSSPRGAIRELVAAMERAAEHSRGGLRRYRHAPPSPHTDGAYRFTRLPGTDRKRRLRANRFSDADDRPGREEFHPDRRFCPKSSTNRAKTLVDASLEGARLRFRPLMMTALAFILGCVPLWIASGAARIARQVRSGPRSLGAWWPRRSSADSSCRHLRCGREAIGGEACRRGHRAFAGSKETDVRVPVIALLLALEFSQRVQTWPQLSQAARTDSRRLSRSGREPERTGAGGIFRRSSMVGGLSRSCPAGPDPEDSCRHNYDGELATERITAARAQLTITRSAEFPQITASGVGINEHAFNSGFPARTKYGTYAADATFQLDLFGRLRRATEAARAQLLVYTIRAEDRNSDVSE